MPDTPNLQQRLHQSYQRDDWQEILHGIFPDGTVRMFSSPQALATSQDNVKATRQLGTIDLPDGNSIALLEVETSNQMKLARNRVGLRNFVASFIDEAGAAAVLAVFHQEGSPDWRLTYASRQTTLDEDTFEITTIETAPRRFTFLLGEHESCRTAAARLAGIEDKGNDIALPDVEKAFSVETLTKDFFKKYKEHYQAFVDHLLSGAEAEATRESFGVPELEDEEEQEKEDKPIRDFVKTLLGRLVFLHFLQKKGWLGCPAGGRKWKGGDSDFLQSFLRFADEKGDSEFFHSKYLCPLFFEALNTPDRPGDLFPLNGTRLPYLNGGLFEEDGDEQRGIDFPVDLFQGLLDFFGEYNFTIDENDPEDHEVGIDPEMLGHIFENLLEDNKDKGAYYTPKAIVSYMARQSLLHYLQTHLGENEELETLLNEKDLANHPQGSFVAENKDRIVERLDEVKICDPAIGSGAFPIGLLQEILWTRLALQPELNTPAERAELKRQIIQHSIHGVDIDPGAIEIARLRFWLALVVDEDEPRPLPNLDYKIHRADSLIEYIRGEPVNLGTEPPTDAGTKAAVEKLIAAKRALFTAQRLPEKRAAWFDLYRALAEVAQAEFTWLRNDTNFADAERMALLTTGIKDFGQWIGKIDGIRKQKVHHQETLLAQLRDWFDDPENPTFLWNLHFGEIFCQGGFDIVIANPPYHSETGLKSTFRKIRESFLSDCYRGKMDLFYFFIHLGIRIAKDNQTLTFITTNYYFTATFADILRDEIRKKTRIQRLINFGEFKIFDSALGQHNAITILKQQDSGDSDANITLVQDSTKGANRLYEILKGSDAGSRTFVKPHSKIFHKDTGYIVVEEEFEQVVLDKIEFVKKVVSDFFDVCEGVQTGLNSVYVFKKLPDSLVGLNTAEKRLIVPFWKNSQIKRWVTSSPESQLLYIQASDDLKGLSLVRSYLESSRERLSSRAQVKRSKTAKWYAVLWPRSESLFRSGSKIVTSYRPARLAFALVDGEFFSGTDTYYVYGKSTQLDLKVLLGVLNSNAIEFWLRKRCKVKGAAIELTGDSIEKIPVPPMNDETKARIREIVDSCETAAKEGKKDSLSTLEGELNQIVYRLFNLKSEEIDLIESHLES